MSGMIVSRQSSAVTGMGSPATGCLPWLPAAALTLLLGGCSTIGYYVQSVSGQLELWRRERPIAEVIADSATPQALRERLARVLEIRAFASRELALPENQSYRRYADLERRYVVWNVFAAPEFSVRPVAWCFVIVGCVSHRGYFSQERAERFARRLSGQGFDVHVGGVPAYSTLGWFSDPVLNTFIHYPEAELARIIFHELSHQVVYVADDTVFNESFASAVDEEGVRRWLARAGDAAQFEEFQRRRRIRAEFAELIDDYRDRLDELYSTGLDPEAMRSRKSAIFEELRREYSVLKQKWGGYKGYDRWFAQTLNNAQLASVGIYNQLVPAFEALLEREGGDFPRFYRAVRELAALPEKERSERLAALVPRRARSED